VLCVLCVLPLASSAGAVNVATRSKTYKQKVANANKREGVLTSSIAAANAHIHSLRGSVTSAESKLARLQSRSHGTSGAWLRSGMCSTGSRTCFALAQRQYSATRHRLAQRLVAVYESDRPDAVAVMLRLGISRTRSTGSNIWGAVTAYDQRVARERRGQGPHLGDP